MTVGDSSQIALLATRLSKHNIEAGDSEHWCVTILFLCALVQSRCLWRKRAWRCALLARPVGLWRYFLALSLRLRWRFSSAQLPAQ